MTELQITRPDDWHVHLRDGAALADTVPATARYFGRAIIMPNLVPPAMTTEQALGYRQRILQQVPPERTFEPLMTLYLTDRTDPLEIERARQSGQVVACKLYPAGATTNSDSGVTRLENVYPVLEKMAEVGMPLLVHGEVTHADVDIFDREKAFLDSQLLPLTQRFPTLRIVLEHITTADAASFVREASSNVAATITVQHLMFNRNHMLAGGMRPHFYCLPILKRNTHQQALQDVAISGDPKFFLGTDSAPHARGAKESACGCAGCFTAPAALELYAEVFEELGALDRLEGFASHHGPDFYRLPRNPDRIKLIKADWTLPDEYPFGASSIVPLRAGTVIRWKVQ